MRAFFAALLLAAAPAAHGAPEGYFVDSTQAAAPRWVYREMSDGDYTLSIRRGFPDSTGARLLGIAEALYPPRAQLIAIAAAQYLEMGSDTTQGPLWWCDGPGIRRVPYAVTAGALGHYVDLTEHYRGEGPILPGAQHLFATDLVYRATIAERDSFAFEGRLYHDVYVAHLRLAFQYDDGTFLPIFEAERTVVMTASGEVLDVEGDGRAREEVHFSSHRAVGRVEQLTR